MEKSERMKPPVMVIFRREVELRPGRKYPTESWTAFAEQGELFAQGLGASKSEALGDLILQNKGVFEAAIRLRRDPNPEW